MQEIIDILRILISWPIAGIVILLLLRKPVTTLLDRLIKAKAGSVEIEFSKLAEEGKPDREEKLFALLIKHDLTHVFIDALNYGREMSYRDTGFRILNAMLVDKNNKIKYITALEDLAKFDTMELTSLGMIMYLCGKAHEYIGNKEDSVRWFNKCKEVTPQMHSHLIEHDKYYNLDVIKAYITSSK